MVLPGSAGLWQLSLSLSLFSKAHALREGKADGSAGTGQGIPSGISRFLKIHSDRGCAGSKVTVSRNGGGGSDDHRGQDAGAPHAQ